MEKNQFKIPKVLAPLAMALKDEVNRRVKLLKVDGVKGSNISKSQIEKETVCDFVGYIFMEDLSVDRFIKILTIEKLYKKYI